LFIVSSAHALSFAPHVSYELSETSPADIVTADFNNDGYNDLAITMSGADGGVGSVSILLGDGSGAFPTHNQITASDVDGLGYTPWGIAATDFNSDGNQDLVVTAYGSGVYKVNTYLGNGAGSFTASSILLTASQSPATAVTGFFNNDAHVDIAVGSDSGSGAGVSVFLGVGDGTFGSADPVTGSNSLSVRDIVTADFNRDGFTDVITTRQVLLNDGNGEFSPAANIGGSTAVGVSVFDASRDGWADVVIAKSSSIDVWLNNQAGSLTFADTYTLASSNITAIAFTDFDTNGDPDFVVTDEFNDQVHIFQGLGDGDFALPESFATGIEPKTIAAVDWSGDNAVDIAAPCRNGGETPYTAVLIQQAGGGTPPAGILQFSGSAYHVAEDGNSLLITVTRISGSAGNISVDYQSGDGTATAGNDYTAVGGALSFAEGETSRTISIPIFDDTIFEIDESFVINLANATNGAALGSPNTATITIIDNNDPQPPSPTPSPTLPSPVSSSDSGGGGISALFLLTIAVLNIYRWRKYF
jgi:hypothetical protein